ncbi:MAG: FapA family protein [Deferribacteraceae bacterium]|jgi:uncharacterized protein (DUF342 family)|nr:FapA family protein [Deferribacteraceae bacterium]
MSVIKALPKDGLIVDAIMSKVYSLGVSDFTSSYDEDGNTVVRINDDNKKYKSKVLVSIEDDATSAYLSIYPPIGGGAGLTYEDIYDTVTEDGIKVNVSYTAIETAAQLNLDGFIVEHLRFATGHRPIVGRDARVVVQFAAAEKKAKVDTDGKIDHKNIDNLILAKKGDLLLTKRPATSGVKGLSVKNSEIIPKAGKDIEIICGEGVMENAVGTAYTATHDGYVQFNDNVLAVHQVYFVHGDVDYAVGNIRFNGTIHVKGDVLSGFRLEASKDVIVDGVCGDCEIVAHQSLYLKTGVKGSKTNLFKAGVDAFIGYCENAKIFAKRNMTIKKYAYNSELQAGNRIEALHGDGIIAGGFVKAYSEIQAKQFGTEGNSKFTIEVGTKYYLDNVMDRLRKERARMVDTHEKINLALSRANMGIPEVRDSESVKNILEIKRNFETTIASMQEREALLEAESRAKRPKVKVRGRIYEGVTVMFFNAASTIREKMENAVFYLDEKYGEVAWISLKDKKEAEELGLD